MSDDADWNPANQLLQLSVRSGSVHESLGAQLLRRSAGACLACAGQQHVQHAALSHARARFRIEAAITYTRVCGTNLNIYLSITLWIITRISRCGYNDGVKTLALLLREKHHAIYSCYDGRRTDH